MDKNEATIEGFILGIVSSIIGGGCIILAWQSGIIANCLDKTTNSCPHELLVFPILILVVIGLFGVVLGGSLMGSNDKAIFNNQKL